MRWWLHLSLFCAICLSSPFAAAQMPNDPNFATLLAPDNAPPRPLLPGPVPSPTRRVPVIEGSLSPRDWVAAPLSNDLLLEPPLQPPGQSPPVEVIPAPTPTPPPLQPYGELPPIDVINGPSPTPLPSYPPGDLIIRLPSVGPAPVELPKVKLWSGSVQFGMDGVEGNSQSMNLRVGFDARLKTDLHLLYLNADYTRLTSNYTTTTNRSYSQGRYERVIPDTDWTIFEGATGEYDHFQPYVFRVTDYAGVGYWLFRNPHASLKARFGGGFEHDFQGPRENYYSPELLVGFDYERKISERQRLTAMLEYMPNVTDIQVYRLNTQAGWELILDQETNLALRFAVRNRYTSDIRLAKPNDLDYAALLMWKF